MVSERILLLILGSKGIIFNRPSIKKLANKLVEKLLKVVASTSGTGFLLDQVIPMYMDLLLEAAKVGNVEFIKIVLYIRISSSHMGSRGKIWSHFISRSYFVPTRECIRFNPRDRLYEG